MRKFKSYFDVIFSDEVKDPEESENIENTDPIKESDEKPLGEEIKLKKELEENEKDNVLNVVQEKPVVEEEEKAITVEEKANVVEVKKNLESKKPLQTVSNRFEALQVICLTLCSRKSCSETWT